MGSGAHPPSFRRLQLRSGKRVDGFAVTLADGTYMKHEGSGGRSKTRTSQAPDMGLTIVNGGAEHALDIIGNGNLK